MTDRRTRTPVPCAEPACPFAGYWQSSRGYCPPHFAEYMDLLRHQVDQAQVAQYSQPAPPGGWPRPSQVSELTGLPDDIGADQ